MSNTALSVLTVTVLAVHLAVLGLALVRRQTRPAMAWLCAIDAVCALIWLGLHPLWFRLPPDWLVFGWAGFELLALAAAILALRRLRAAIIAVWIAAGLHTAAAALAVLFALTFRITRLF